MELVATTEPSAPVLESARSLLADLRKAALE
jgi:hypothetical protein